VGGGQNFPHAFRPALGPPSFLYNGYRVFAGGKTAGSWRWPPTPSSAEIKERVELYLYSPLGFRGGDDDGGGAGRGGGSDDDDEKDKDN